MTKLALFQALEMCLEHAERAKHDEALFKMWITQSINYLILYSESKK